jgi:ketosteroid isomerase-like protein
MSQENVQMARALIEAWNRRDIDALLAAAAPDVEWTPAGPAAVESAVYRGPDKIARGFESTWQGWEEFHLDESEIRDLSESALWLGRATMRGAASHVQLDQEWAVLIAFTDREVTSLRAFPTWRDALADLGLEG